MRPASFPRVARLGAVLVAALALTAAGCIEAGGSASRFETVTMQVLVPGDPPWAGEPMELRDTALVGVYGAASGRIGRILDIRVRSVAGGDLSFIHDIELQAKMKADLSYAWTTIGDRVGQPHYGTYEVWLDPWTYDLNDFLGAFLDAVELRLRVWGTVPFDDILLSVEIDVRWF